MTENSSAEPDDRPGPTLEPTDEALLSAFLDGEATMFSHLVRRYELPLFSFLCRLSGNAEDAADLFQETFIRVFQRASTFQEKSRFKTWLYAIASNVCHSHLRRELRMADVSRTASAQNPETTRGSDAAAESSEIGGRVSQLVGTLPPDQREVFVLRIYEEMSFQEIADTLNRPLGTVKSQMRLALGKLRSELRSLAQAYDIT